MHEGVVVSRANNVEPIIDEETFDRAMRAFAGRKRGRMPGPYLGSGLLECALRGAKLLSRPTNRTLRYVCIKDRGGCGKISVQTQYVDPFCAR